MRADANHAAILGAASYSDLRARLGSFDCRRCGLAAGRTRLVVDRGNPGAKILLVGEGPGAEEDRQGQAFVGRSGKLLDSMLLEAGIDPAKDVLIANVVKCRPPGNRPPKADEVESCLPYLLRQIALVAPKCLGLLGATAAKHLLVDRELGRLSDHVGKRLDDGAFPGVGIFILFHPAFILRNPRRRSEMVEHLRGLRGA